MCPPNVLEMETDRSAALRFHYVIELLQISALYVSIAASNSSAVKTCIERTILAFVSTVTMRVF